MGVGAGPGRLPASSPSSPLLKRPRRAAGEAVAMWVGGARPGGERSHSGDRVSLEGEALQLP